MSQPPGWTPAQYQQPSQPPPTGEERDMRFPPWAAPLLLSLITALGSGAVGVGVGRTTAESPAAIVTNLEHLQTSQARQESKLDALDAAIQIMNTEMVRDRWKGTDQRAWVLSDFTPLELKVDKLDERLRKVESNVTLLRASQ